MTLTKKRQLEYKRDGGTRILYLWETPDGTWRSCSPMHWHKLDGPDSTTPATLEEAALATLKRRRWTQMRERVEDNLWLTSLPERPAFPCVAVATKHNLTF